MTVPDLGIGSVAALSPVCRKRLASLEALQTAYLRLAALSDRNPDELRARVQKTAAQRDINELAAARWLYATIAEGKEQP